jgi:hypothetical protein
MKIFTFPTKEKDRTVWRKELKCRPNFTERLPLIVKLVAFVKGKKKES